MVAVVLLRDTLVGIQEEVGEAFETADILQSRVAVVVASLLPLSLVAAVVGFAAVADTADDTVVPWEVDHLEGEAVVQRDPEVVVLLQAWRYSFEPEQPRASLQLYRAVLLLCRPSSLRTRR